MNERIRELAEQAGMVYHSEHQYDDFDEQKFAELIIQKCVSKIALIGISNFDSDIVMWTVETSIDSIKEHFGVE